VSFRAIGTVATLVQAVGASSETARNDRRGVRTFAAARRAIVSVCTVVRGSRLVTIGDPERVAGGAEMSDEDEVGLSTDEELRRRAVKRLRARAGFWTHLLIYLTVNTFIIVIWVVSSGGFFWPVFPIVFWGIGLIANAWDAFGPDLVSEDRIQREIERLRH
jgi:hypothetical protein